MFAISANETTIKGFYKDHATGNLRTRKSYKTLEFLSPCREKKYMDETFLAGKTFFDAFNPDLLSMSITLFLALCLVFPRYLFNMGPAFKFSRVLESPRIDQYLKLILPTHRNLEVFHRLMKNVDPLAMNRANLFLETYIYECATG